MEKSSRLWAIGYEDLAHADQAREAITRLGWDYSYPYLTIVDIAVVVRHPDGTFTLNREPYPAIASVLGLTLVGFLAGLVTATPLSGATIGAFLGGAKAALGSSLGIDAEFLREVETQMTPGSSALFVLEEGGDMDEVLHGIRGLGGTILKTNVDLARAKRIQSALAAGSGDAISPGGRSLGSAAAESRAGGAPA